MDNPINLIPRCAFCGGTRNLHTSVDSFVPDTWICSECVHAFVEAEEVMEGTEEARHG
jgi:hypothetical protein